MRRHSSMRSRVVVWVTAAVVSWLALHTTIPTGLDFLTLDAAQRGTDRLFWFGFLVIAGWNLFRHYRDPGRKRSTAMTVTVQAPSGEPTVRVEAPA